MTEHAWSDDRPVYSLNQMRVYKTRDAAQRVAWFPAQTARYLSAGALARALRDPTVDPADTLLLPDSARATRPVDAQMQSDHAAASPTYRRASSDRFEIAIDSATCGWVRVIESYDEGWQATLDGRSTRIFPADGLAMAVLAPSGKHELVLEFFTPGQRTGVAISAIGAVLIVALSAFVRRSGERPRRSNAIARANCE